MLFSMMVMMMMIGGVEVNVCVCVCVCDRTSLKSRSRTELFIIYTNVLRYFCSTGIDQLVQITTGLKGLRLGIYLERNGKIIQQF